MSIITLLLTIAVVGFCVWLVVTLVPLPEPFRQVIIGVACLGLLIWILQYAGLIHGWLRL